MLNDIGENAEYSEGIANVFIESMKAPGRSLHSKAIALFNALVENAHISGKSLVYLLTCRHKICKTTTIECH
jgi:hypothetical protein